MYINVLDGDKMVLQKLRARCSRIDMELRMKQKALVFVIEELKQRIAVTMYGRELTSLEKTVH